MLYISSKINYLHIINHPHEANIRLVWIKKLKNMKAEKRVLIVAGAWLTFVEVKNSKNFTFSSENEKLQSWIDGVKKKKVPEKDFHYVVKAAREFMQEDAALSAPKTVVKALDKSPNFGGDYISALHDYCQRNKLDKPVFKEADNSVDPQLFFFSVSAGAFEATGWDYSKKEARQAAARNLLESFA